MHQPIYFHTTQAIHFKQFQYQNTWMFMVHFMQTGTVFTVQKTEQVGCPWAAHSSNIGSSLWNQIPWPFLASYTPNHELMHNLSHKAPKQYVDCHGLSKRALRIFTFRFQVLGLIKRPLMTSNQPNHHKTLKSRVKQVG